MIGMRHTVRLGVLATLLTAHCVLVAQSVVPQASKDGLASIVSELQTGEYDTALEHIQRQLEHSPKNSQLWTLQGIAFSGKRDKKDALGAFRHALGISPDNLLALEGAAQIEYDDNDKDAVALLQHILQLRPG